MRRKRDVDGLIVVEAPKFVGDVEGGVHKALANLGVEVYESLATRGFEDDV